jgi:heptosyltransferase-2
MGDADNILVVQLAGLGDMILATPALLALRESFPKARIFLLTNSRGADIVKDSGDIDEIFVSNNIREFMRISARLRGLHFDTVINLYRLYSLKGALKMFLLFTTIGGRRWVGRDTDGRGFFYHLKVKDSLKDREHEVVHKLDIIRALGGKAVEVKFKVSCRREDEVFIDKLLIGLGINENESVAGINCTTFQPKRNWTQENYRLLAGRLRSELPAKVVFCGSRFNYETTDLSAKAPTEGIIDLVGKLKIGQLIALIKRCNIFISPDSGPGHLAAALNVPLVSLFGLGEYDKFRPYGDARMVRIISTPMESITVQEVLAAVGELWKK